MNSKTSVVQGWLQSSEAQKYGEDRGFFKSFHNSLVGVLDEFLHEKVDYNFNIKFLGKSFSGKSCIIDALCRQDPPIIYKETPGMVVYKTKWPIKLQNQPREKGQREIHIVGFTLFDIGHKIKQNFPYLQETPTEDSFNTIVLVCSLIDEKSFEYVKNNLNELPSQIPKVVVATQSKDQIFRYQVSLEQLRQFSNETGIPTCAINVYSHFSNHDGSSVLVELLAHTILRSNQNFL
eukprot:gb/GECH01012203.1/.p1 GENE.gb/GECH01012203.1/~~gb/GECH01012203.1/.p1  ORF type:complete len:235 (+),score=23.64 gb/GECH01012203.1/:1-705(+)